MFWMKYTGCETSTFNFWNILTSQTLQAELQKEKEVPTTKLVYT